MQDDKAKVHERLDENGEAVVQVLVEGTMKFVASHIPNGTGYSSFNMALNVFVGCISILGIEIIPIENEEEFIKYITENIRMNFEANNARRRSKR